MRSLALSRSGKADMVSRIEVDLNDWEPSVPPRWAVRHACDDDVRAISDLVMRWSKLEPRSVMPRTEEQVLRSIDNWYVIFKLGGILLACAELKIHANGRAKISHL